MKEITKRERADRLLLNETPYGAWERADGSVVLFNRLYCPIYEIGPTGLVTHPSTASWIQGITRMEGFWEDRAPARTRVQFRARRDEVLLRFGVGPAQCRTDLDRDLWPDTYGGRGTRWYGNYSDRFYRPRRRRFSRIT